MLPTILRARRVVKHQLCFLRKCSSTQTDLASEKRHPLWNDDEPWTKELYPADGFYRKDLPEKEAETPSNAQQRGSYLGSGDEYIPTLTCKLRPDDTIGKSLSTYRKEANVPCILTGKMWKKNVDENIHFTLQQTDIFDHYNIRGAKYQCTPHRLEFPERPELNCYAFVREFHVHPWKNIASALTFVRFDPENSERRLIEVPVKYWNEDKAPGLKFHGYLNVELWSVRMWVNSLKFPTQLNVNVHGMEIGDSIQYKDIEIHPEFKYLTKERRRCMCSIIRLPRGDD